MPAISASAPGKIILFGEHAVVYGRPALAVPVKDVRAKAIVMANPRGTPGSLRIQAPDVGIDSWLDKLPEDHPLVAAINQVFSALEVVRSPACTLRITSSIPIAAGLGSGTAVSVAIIRALSAFLGHPLPDEVVSSLAYKVEKLHHGSPSGIDNTVITYARPIFFVRGSGKDSDTQVETLRVPESFILVIADTGIPSPTAATVGDVRIAWKASPERYEDLFDAAGNIALAARQAIESGHPENLGALMNENHQLLGEMGVSSIELDRLVDAARRAGALGAKLSGAGRGGNMIALASTDTSSAVAEALETAGATNTIITKNS